MKTKPNRLFLFGIFLIGLVLRTPFTVIPTVLTYIADGLNVSVASLGTLTSIPLFMFAIFSSLAPKLAQKIGLEQLFTIVLVIMALGSILRIINVPFLYVGTALIGMAIAILNVLLPSIIKENQPDKIAFLTTVYTTSMGLSSAVASFVAVPIVQVSSWKTLIILLTVMVAFALIFWLPNMRHNHKIDNGKSSNQTTSIWRNHKAWYFLVFAGFQSLLFYTTMTWLPTMATQSGLSENAAGVLASIYSLISLPLAMIVPGITEHFNNQQRKWMITLVSIIGILGMNMLFFPTPSFTYWLIVNLLIGICVSVLFPYMLVLFSVKSESASGTAQLSGMSQTGGYLLAAFGPTLFGYSFNLFNSWFIGVIALIIVTVIMLFAAIKVEDYDKIA